MTALQPYPAYRDSGVEWLGEVPEHWEVRRLKTLCDMRSGDAITAMSITEVGKYPVFGGNGIRGYAARYTHDGNFVLIGRQGALCGNVHIARGRFWASEHAVVATLRRKHALEWFGAMLEIMNLNQYSLAAAQPGLSVDRVLNLWVPVPPAQEQTAIARFLDDADRRIRRSIRARERLIELLEEQKQAIIHQAVTGQIAVQTGHPYPAYRDSGVEWLGEMPDDWEVVQLGRIAVDRCDGPFGSGLKSSHYSDEGIRVVRLQNIGLGKFDDADAAFISAEHYSTLGDHSVETDDVLIAGLGDANHPAGRACVAPEDIGLAMVKADCFRFRLDQSRALPRFVALQLTATAHSASGLLSTGATRQRVNLRSTAARRIAIPEIQEQSRIVDYVTREIASHVDAQDNAKRGIDLLTEYRIRLTADVVTGKLVVREAAASLPEADPPDGGTESTQSIPIRIHMRPNTM